MSTITTTPISQVLRLDEMLQESKTLSKQHYIGATKIAVGIVRKAAFAVINDDPGAFDPNPADHGCQMRSDFLLRHRFSGHLREEAGELLKKMKALSPIAHKQASLEKLDQISVSEEMAFLIQSALLTLTKAKGMTNSFGFPFTVTEPGKLQTFSKTLLPFALLERLTQLSAERVSAASIEHMRKAAASMRGPDQEMHMRALSERNIRHIALDGIRKSFALIPIQVKIFLETLKELESVVAIQHLKDPSKRIFFKSTPEGFVSIDPREVAEGIPMAVFEIGLQPEKKLEDVQSAVESLGLENIVLHLACKQPPYDRQTSSLSDVKEDEVKELIKYHRALTLDLPFEIFHIKVDTQKRR